MVKWHETWFARIGLRLGGLGVLWAAYRVAALLYAETHLHPPRPASLAELGLCLVLVMLLVIGNALFFVGPGLWKQVENPARWHAALTEPRAFEIFGE